MESPNATVDCAGTKHVQTNTNRATIYVHTASGWLMHHDLRKVAQYSNQIDQCALRRRRAVLRSAQGCRRAVMPRRRRKRFAALVQR